MNAAEEIQVSLIIAAYNAEHTIARTLESIRIQQDVSYEVIVVNDGSTDRTLSVIEDFPDLPLRVLSQENAGAASARNHGWKHSCGEYIFFLDADDELLPEALNKHLEVLKDRPPGFSYARYRCVDEERRVIKLSALPQEEGMLLEKFLMEEGWMLPSVCVLHRKVLEEVGGFDVTQRYCEDREFGLRVSKCFPAYPVPEVCLNYLQSVSGAARSNISEYARAVSEHRYILERCAAFLSERELEVLYQTTFTSLCSRFLLYGTLRDGKRLYQDEHFTLSCRGLKPLLTRISLLTGINFLGALFRCKQLLPSRKI